MDKKLKIMRVLILFLLCAACLSACNTDAGEKTQLTQEQIVAQIRTLESALAQNLSQPAIDTATADSLIDKAMRYANSFPQDSLSPQFLFRAADVARGIGEQGLAVTLWGKVAKVYEGSRYAPESLFLLAFTLDNDLRDTSRARQAYEEFLEQYPKHPLANDARELLKVLQSGKTPEEMIREFQQQH